MAGDATERGLGATGADVSLQWTFGHRRDLDLPTALTPNGSPR